MAVKMKRFILLNNVVPKDWNWFGAGPANGALARVTRLEPRNVGRLFIPPTAQSAMAIAPTTENPPAIRSQCVNG
jgi:hypothetical protein